ncbi:unnamed protein product [Blepharisma stoltei]|uniref:C3H1-type domain-containing protein n=1 Tax=Blepharisma stoltei TaxID=1481888 RepID=A0AAU9IH28_9CILI|nr:unnamed protein product [Blepharisma stoltei]
MPAEDLIIETLLENHLKNFKSCKQSSPKPKYKTEICKNWPLNKCTFGENCAFAHGKTELKAKGPNYKKEECKNFAYGFCKYGERCTFIHQKKIDRLQVFKKITAQTDAKIFAHLNL